jgi:hypothetical protein
MVNKKMKGGMVNSNMLYDSMDDLEKRIKKSKRREGFMERMSAKKAARKAEREAENIRYSTSPSSTYGDVDAMDEAKKVIERLKQEQLVKADKRLKSEAAGGQDTYNYPVESGGTRQLHQLPLSDLENDIMKVRENNCNDAINRTCRMNCSRLIGTQPKCSKCVDDNLQNIEEKCKGYPLDDRENYPKELISKLEVATPERIDNVKLRSKEEGGKQIRNIIKRAPEDHNIMNIFSRSRKRAKEKRLKSEAVAALGPHGLGLESSSPPPGGAMGGARRRRRTKRRKPKKSKKSKRTRRTRRQRR